MDTINISDFQKIEIRIGRVMEAKAVEGSEKLVRCVVDFGDELGERIIFSGIKKWYTAESLPGKLLPYVVNLEPRKMFGEESQGMLVAAAPEVAGEEAAVLLVPEGDIAPGTKVI